MVRRLLFVVGLVILISNRGHADPIQFTASLNGAQEATPNGSTATGLASLTLNDAQTRLEISLQIVGLDLDGLQTADVIDDVLGIHIHRAAVGVNGPIVFGLTGPVGPNNDLNGDLVIDGVAGTIFSAWDLNEGQATTLAAELPNLLAGLTYLNVHTSAFPGGEIRGQISRVPEPATLVLLGIGVTGLMAVRRRERTTGMTGTTGSSR